MKRILIGYPLDKYKIFSPMLEKLRTEYSLTFKDYDYKWLSNNIHKFDIIIPNLRTIIDSEVVDKAKKLSLIFTPTTGTDHIAVNEKQIKVLSLRHFQKKIQSINSTAELGFSLLLDVSRRISHAHYSVVSECKWNRNDFLGNELNGKTIGIIGMGRLGKKIAQYSKAFGMNVLYWDRIKSRDGKRINDINQLLSLSDYVLLSISYTPETFHLINRKNISKFKKGSFLVNISRGKLIDEKALCSAIKQNLIAGVGVDVLEFELEDFRKSPLYKFACQNPDANIVITPHIGGATLDAWLKVFSLVFDKLTAGKL